MPYHTNSIATFQFEDIRGSLISRSEQLEEIVRPGRDDSLIRKTGVRSR